MLRRWYSTKPTLPQLPFGFADVALLLLVFMVFYAITSVGKDAFVPFHPPIDAPHVTLNPALLPYYALRSTLRMFIGLAASLLFALSYGYAAARNKLLRNVLVAMLDILQSVPITGFLTILNLFMVRLFAGSLLGPEMVAIFAIFTGQAWNMAYSFYQNLITIPKELDEASSIFRLNKWQKFTNIEVPAGVIGLVWNGMMSFGGGWFFVSLSESVKVGEQDYALPGLGSFAALAIKQGDYHMLGLASLTMICVILLSDQFFWRPMVAWAEKFKMEKQIAEDVATSWFYDVLKASKVPRWFRRLIRTVSDKIWGALPKRAKATEEAKPRTRRLPIKDERALGYGLGIIASVGVFSAFHFISSLGAHEALTCVGLALVTLLRVLFVLAVSTVIWTPVGVMIGFNPRLARFFQPVVQFMVTYPAIFIFPFVIPVIVSSGLGINLGSVGLMMLGTQWYILFNVIAGAMSVPTDLKWMVTNMQVKGWPKWRDLILPAIFPALVTGAITASGGAWNVSIIAEHPDKPGGGSLEATGLGNYIMSAYENNQTKQLVLGVMLMCLFVVVINRFFWRRLYMLAEERYKLG